MRFFKNPESWTFAAAATKSSELLLFNDALGTCLAVECMQKPELLLLEKQKNFGKAMIVLRLLSHTYIHELLYRKRE